MGRPSFRALLVAIALLACTSAAYAAGLGKLTVMSDLGQPLRAEIDVVAVEKGEMDSLNARLASVEAYLQNNLPYPPPSLGLKLSLERRASGAPYISATTVQPVNEPFVDVLVDLTWNGGRILRAYTALLDPPAYAEERAAEAAPQGAAAQVPQAPPATSEPPVETRLGSEFQQKEPIVAPVPGPVPGAPMEGGEQPAVAAAPPPGGAPTAAPPTQAGMPKAPQPAPTPEEEQVTVKRGDTLSKIAKQYMADDVSLEQMLVVLFRNNKEAFSGNNMNRLKAGKVLQLPDPDEVAALERKQARREVRLQTADFNAYRERIASAAGRGAPSSEQAGQSAAGSVSGKVHDQGAPAPSEPKEMLKLSQGDTAAAAAQQRARALEEELSAREKTIKEQAERVAKLEKTVKDMQALLDIKSKGMADAQRKATAAPPEAPKLPAPTAAPAPVAPVPPPAAQSAPVEPPAPAVSRPAPPATEPAGAAKSPPATAMKPKPKARLAAEAPPAETGLIDEVLGNPLYLGGGAAILGLLGFLGFRMLRNRRAAAYDDDVTAEKKNPELAPPLTRTDTSGAMAAAARAVAPAAPAAPVSEEVDPLAEAEIYLAYGRDGQAEEILREALHANPRRYEIHVKLLEIYAKRKDTGAFDTLAREVYGGTGGQGDIWLQVARLGYPLDPQNPRYAAGKTAGGAAAAAPVAAVATAVPGLDENLDFNLGLEDTSHGTRTDIDLTRLGGAAGSSTDIDLSNLGEGLGGGSDIVDLSSLSGLPQQALEVSDMDLDLGAEEPGTKSSGLDFDFDLSGLSGAEAARPQAQRPSPETTQFLDRSLTETVADAGESGMGTVEFDLSRISLDTGATGKTEPTFDVDGESASIPEIDLSGISLDLGTDSTTSGGATGSSAGKDDHWYDVQTKFDLAKAYQEMGDKEGAREILQEVLAEGDAEQQTAAQRVLETLA